MIFLHFSLTLLFFLLPLRLFYLFHLRKERSKIYQLRLTPNKDISREKEILFFGRQIVRLIHAGKKDGSLNPSSSVKRNYREWKPFFPDHTTAGESHGRNPFLPATGVALQKKELAKDLAWYFWWLRLEGFWADDLQLPQEAFGKRDMANFVSLKLDLK